MTAGLGSLPKEVISCGLIIPSPFLPHSNDPKIIAETIDKVVNDETFRKKLAEEEYEFVMNLSEPNMIAKQWDELFEKTYLYPICTWNRQDNNF